MPEEREESERSDNENLPSPDKEPISSGPIVIALASIRNTEAYLRWQGAQWSIALNLTGFVALLYRIILIPGTAELDVEWYSVLRRDGKLLDFWNKKFTEHERRNTIRGGIRLFTSAEFKKLSSSRDRLQRKLERITVVFIGGWSIASVVFFTLACIALKGVVR